MVLRGTSANPWDLGPLAALQDNYEVLVAVSPANEFSLGGLGLPTIEVNTVSSLLPGRGPAGLAARVAGERFLALDKALEGAALVHTAEIGNWYSAQAADLKQRLGFKLVTTCWETLPLLNGSRNFRTRPYRRRTLAATDRFLATTDRARATLLLEGAAPEKVVVCEPGVDLERFAVARDPARSQGTRHLVLSVGRLVWEKGHQDLLRAVALLRSQGRHDIDVAIVGVGPEESKLRSLTQDLGLESAVSFVGWVPHEEIAVTYGKASCLVLASLPTRYWEEQFGMVLVEAMAAHLPVVAAASGAIPEVVGDSADLFSPGDWVGLAEVLGNGPLSGPPVSRRSPSTGRLERFSNASAAARLRETYDELIG